MHFVYEQLMYILHQGIYVANIRRTFEVSIFESQLFVRVCNWVNEQLALSILRKCDYFLYGRHLETQKRTDVSFFFNVNKSGNDISDWSQTICAGKCMSPVETDIINVPG